jgi:hypothetical protein
MRKRKNAASTTVLGLPANSTHNQPNEAPGPMGLFTRHSPISGYVHAALLDTGQNLDQMEHPAGRTPTKTGGMHTCQPLTQPCWTEPRPDGTWNIQQEGHLSRRVVPVSHSYAALPCWTEPRPDGTSSRKDTYQDEWHLPATHAALLDRT